MKDGPTDKGSTTWDYCLDWVAPSEVRFRGTLRSEGRRDTVGLGTLSGSNKGREGRRPRSTTKERGEP